MEISISREDTSTIIEIRGDLDGKNAPIVQQKVMPLCTSGCKIVLDMSHVYYMSSAGLRLMLSLYRQIMNVQGKMVLVGLSDESRNVMSSAGFLNYFITKNSVEEGIATMN